jgi:hypothetical protein
MEGHGQKRAEIIMKGGTVEQVPNLNIWDAYYWWLYGMNEDL